MVLNRPPGSASAEWRHLGYPLKAGAGYVRRLAGKASKFAGPTQRNKMGGVGGTALVS